MAITSIEWTATRNPDGTWSPGYSFNPWVGCTPVSCACDFCYAETWAKRSGHPELWQGERRRTSAANWQQPHKWNQQASAEDVRRRVFCASLADVFDNQVPTRWRDDLWHLIEQTPHLDWLLLTKRPQNIAKMLPDPRTGVKAWRAADWPNVMFGTTVENQEEADRRLPFLRTLWLAGARTFVSYEPALGPVDWAPWANAISWLISGGESGPRPSHPDWHRAARDFGQRFGIPYLFKQWGSWAPDGVNFVSHTREQPGAITPLMSSKGAYVVAWRSCADRGPLSEGDQMHRIGKTRAGRLLDGREHNDFPEAR